LEVGVKIIISCGKKNDFASELTQFFPMGNLEWIGSIGKFYGIKKDQKKVPKKSWLAGQLWIKDSKAQSAINSFVSPYPKSLANRPRFSLTKCAFHSAVVVAVDPGPQRRTEPDRRPSFAGSHRRSMTFHHRSSSPESRYPAAGLDEIRQPMNADPAGWPPALAGIKKI
jgi:hypothetical protein